MRKLEKNEPEMRTGKIEQACKRYGLGKNTMRKVADEAGAVVRIGRCYLVNFSKVDAYMDRISE
jgi:hypothetical protein